jgi:heme/copper-type cytochrome/quinol oxidase subunit 4
MKRLNIIWLLKNRPGMLAKKLVCLLVAVVAIVQFLIPVTRNIYLDPDAHYSDYMATLFYVLIIGILLSVVFEKVKDPL